MYVFLNKFEKILDYCEKCLRVMTLMLTFCPNFIKFKKFFLLCNMQSTITAPTRIGRAFRICIDKIYVRTNYKCSTVNKVSDFLEHHY